MSLKKGIVGIKIILQKSIDKLFKRYYNYNVKLKNSYNSYKFELWTLVQKQFIQRTR